MTALMDMFRLIWVASLFGVVSSYSTPAKGVIQRSAHRPLDLGLDLTLRYWYHGRQVTEKS